MIRPSILNRDRIVDAAVAVADRGGLGAVSMRNVGRQLGVEAMSLYHHVAGKDALLDALAEWLFEHIDVPAAEEAWRTVLERRADSTRRVLSQHRWALDLIDSRPSPGPAQLRRYDAVLGNLLAEGFDPALASHAVSVLDAYVYGFAMTEANLPFEADGETEQFAAGLDVPADDYPNLVRLLSELVVGRGYSFADEYGYGLELILEGIGRRLDGGDA